MQPKRFPPDDPREWLNRARSNLIRAEAPVPSVYLEDLCFDAQQAAEKAIKAVLIVRGTTFPYTHDLAKLAALLDESGEAVPLPVRQSAFLTQFAYVTRYPGLDDPVSDEAYRQAVAIAEAVVRWAEEQVAMLRGNDP